MHLRISSVPARDPLPDPGTSRPPTPAASERAEPEAAAIVDLTSRLIRLAVASPAGQASGEDPGAAARRTLDLAASDPAGLLRAQHAPDTARVMALLFGD